MAHHVKIKPVRLREFSDLLGVDALRIVAYRAVCSCGWRSGAQADVTRAREESFAHTHPFTRRRARR